jgi:hypothetical protein
VAFSNLLVLRKMKLSFANKGLDAINLGNILHHKSLKPNTPPYIKDQSVPIISYVYTKPIASFCPLSSIILDGIHKYFKVVFPVYGFRLTIFRSFVEHDNFKVTSYNVASQNTTLKYLWILSRIMPDNGKNVKRRT